MSQLPGLIEKSEPALESALRSAIQKMAAYPAEAATFQMNWTKLNAVVTDELSKISSPPSAPTGGKRTKSSKKTKRTKRI